MLRIVQLLRSFLVILITGVAQCFQFLRLALSPRTALIAEILFLRKQLVFYQEHQIPPRTLTASARLSLVLRSRFFNWREALDDSQTGNPHGLASCGMQVVVAVEVADGKTSDSA